MPFPDRTLALVPTTTWPTLARTTRAFDADIFVQGLDRDLGQAWDIMTRFCALANISANSNNKLPKEVLLDTMGSVMYRLLHLRFKSGTTDEVTRLGLLSFSASVFLMVRHGAFSMPCYPSAFRDCLLNLAQPTIFPYQVLLWLLVAGSTAGFPQGDDVHLKSSMRTIATTHHVVSWDEMKEILKSVMWIDIIHDGAARVLFDSISS